METEKMYEAARRKDPIRQEYIRQYHRIWNKTPKRVSWRKKWDKQNRKKRYEKYKGRYIGRYQANYRAAKIRKRTGKEVDTDIIKELLDTQKKCQKCGATKSLCIDHIFPVSKGVITAKKICKCYVSPVIQENTTGFFPMQNTN